MHKVEITGAWVEKVAFSDGKEKGSQKKKAGSGRTGNRACGLREGLAGASMEVKSEFYRLFLIWSTPM